MNATSTFRPSASSPSSVHGPVGERLPLGHRLADADDRLLVDAGVLVRPLELGEAVDVGAHFLGWRRRPRRGRGRRRAGCRRSRRVPARRADDDRARVARGDVLHAGADERRAGAQQRHRLALHVRPHQRAVRVVVLEERDERRRDRDELLGRHVDELHGVARREDEVALLARVDALLRQAAGRRRASTFAWATMYWSSSQAER